MLLWVVTALISTASAKSPAVPAAKPIAASSNVESFRKPYYSYLRVQSQIIGQLGQRTLHSRSSTSLRQKFEAIRGDYRSLRADVVAPKFDVQKVGAGIRRYNQNFHSYVTSVAPADRRAADGLAIASTSSTRYLVAAVDHSAPIVAGRKQSDAPALVGAMGGPAALGLGPKVDLNRFNFSSLVPTMSLRNGLPVAQTIDLKTNAIQSELRSMASLGEAPGNLNFEESDSPTARAGGANEDKTQTKDQVASRDESATEGQAEGEAQSESDVQAGVDNKGLLDPQKEVRKLDPTSRKDLECLERGNIDTRGACSAGSSLDQIGYKNAKGGPSCSAATGGGTLCDPAFYPGTGGSAVCANTGKTCKQGSREIIGNPPTDYVNFLTNNRATVEAKIARIRETCDGQSSAACQEMLNRASSIEVWMGWNGQRYQSVATQRPPVPTGVWNAGWLGELGYGSGVGAQDAVSPSGLAGSSRQ